MLYPLKFKPRYKERIWGGEMLKTRLGKKLPEGKLIGESWELSGVERDLSVVANGPLKGNNIEELTEVYMGDLVGDHIYNKFGLQFPLLVKLIDAQDTLSIQVHPDDRLAAERHNSYGKTEMWYVIDCEPGAQLSVGFNRPVTREEYVARVEAGTLAEILNRIEVKPGDAYFIPAGVIHAIGKGLLIAEIQQTSDITYRVFDWNRTDASGKGRELHTELAVDAIKYDLKGPFDITAAPQSNRTVNLVSCPYFTTNVIGLQGAMARDHSDKDSFVIYMVTEGSMTVGWKGGRENAAQGETVLLPAMIDEITLEGTARLLECYIE